VVLFDLNENILSTLFLATLQNLNINNNGKTTKSVKNLTRSTIPNLASSGGPIIKAVMSPLLCFLFGVVEFDVVDVDVDVGVVISCLFEFEGVVPVLVTLTSSLSLPLSLPGDVEEGASISSSFSFVI